MTSGMPESKRFQAPFKDIVVMVHLRVFPKQHVMRKVNAVLGRQIHIRDRHVSSFDLAEGIAELQLRHVLSAGQFRPAGLCRNPVRIHRRAAGRTTARAIADQAAPGTSVC